MRRAAFAALLAVVAFVAPREARSTALVFKGIRPGAWMSAPGLCTMNFIFNASGRLEDGGPFYIGTARHCFGRGDQRGTAVRLRVVLGADNPVDLEIGTVSYMTKGGTAPSRDYALVRIKPELEHLISPSIAVIGGPTSTYTGSAFDEPILMTGHGAGIGTGGTVRAGRLTCPCPDYGPYAWGGILPVIGGDSGSAVRTLDGAAVGDVAHDALNYYTHSRGELPPEGTTVMGTRVTRVMEEFGLNVVTCPSNTPWPEFGCPPA